MKKNRKLIVGMSVVLVILVGIAGALFMKSGSKSEKEHGHQEVNQIEHATSTIEQQIHEEESYVIETDFIRLYYPQKWEENLQTEVVEEDGYVVVFYGKVKEKDRQKLFEIVFNGDADTGIGTVEDNGENIYVGFNLAEPELGVGWSDEEADTIYAMQEDVNFLIGMLEREAGFKAE